MNRTFRCALSFVIWCVTSAVFADELASKFSSALKQVLPEAQITIVNKDEIRLSNGEDKRVFFLDTLRALCADSSNNCDAEISKRVQMREIFNSKAALKDVVFIVRSTGYVESAKAAMVAMIASDAMKSTTTSSIKLEDSLPVLRRVGRTYALILARDTPSAVSPLSAKGLSELSLSDDQAWTLADQNVGQLLRDIVPRTDSSRANYRVLQQNFYAPSYLFSPIWAEYLKMQKTTRAWACIPAPDFAVVVLDDVNQLNDLRLICTNIAKRASRAVSDEVLEWKAGAWSSLSNY
jgi:hypothetical protein